MEEMQFKDRHRYGAMLEHIGTICKFALEIGFKHQLGRWDYAVIDESATGLPLSLSACQLFKCSTYFSISLGL